MDLLTNLILSVLGKFLGTEIEAWAPTFAQQIIARAIQRLPESERERFQEEWTAHLNECPGNIVKILHAVGCFRSAKAISAVVDRREMKKIRNARETHIEAPKQVSENKIHRLSNGVLAKFERRLLVALVRRVPLSASPDHFTAIGLIGAFVSALGFIGCNWSNWFLIAVFWGLFLNWLGVSLDGMLVRIRTIRRPNYGYFIDQSADLVSQTGVLVGLGVSPYFTLGSALLVLSLFLLMSSYSYLCVVTGIAWRRSYMGMSSTEFRLLIVAWSLLAAWIGPAVRTRAGGFFILDLVLIILSASAYAAFVWIIRSDLARVQRHWVSLRYGPRRRGRRPW